MHITNAIGYNPGYSNNQLIFDENHAWWIHAQADPHFEDLDLATPSADDIQWRWGCCFLYGQCLEVECTSANFAYSGMQQTGSMRYCWKCSQCNTYYEDANMWDLL